MAVDDVFQGSYFSFEADGIPMGFFTGCSGLGIEHEVVEYKSVSNLGKQEEVKIPGRRTYGEVVLKRGFTPDTGLMDWCQLVIAGKIKEARKTGAIVVYDSTATEVARFSLDNMWPSKISSSDPDTGSAAVLVEEITIVHERLEWV